MNTYDICIFQRPGDTHFGMELVDHNGESITGEIKYNKYGVSIPYAIYDAVVDAITRLQAEVSTLRHNTKVINAASGGDINNINKLIAEKHQLSEAITSCGSENKELHRKIDELTAKYEELEQNFKEVCDEVVAEQENNAKLREKLKKARETNPDIEKLNLKLDIAHKENMNLNNEIAELRKETIRLTSELNKEQCKNVSNELKELAKNMYSTEIPDTLENNDYITRPSKFEGVYDVGRYNAVTGRLDHVAKLHIAEDDEWAFAKFHKITCMFKPCQISDIIAWGKLNEDARFNMRFVMDDDKPDTQDNDTKPETKHEEHPMDSILKAFSGILPKTVNVMDTKNGDGHHIADLLTSFIRSMDEDTFKQVFGLDDEE